MQVLQHNLNYFEIIFVVINIVLQKLLHLYWTLNIPLILTVREKVENGQVQQN